jgi:hypothetical protein
MFPNETNKILGTDKDCFYRDELVPAFLEELNKLILTKK